MTVRLDPVRREDVDALCRMDVREDQVGFVAHNAMSLAEQPYETGAHPFVIRDGDTLYVTEAPFTQWTKVISAITGTASSAASITSLTSP